MDVLGTNMIEGQIQCYDQTTLLYEESGDELDKKKACYFRNPGSDGLNWETLIPGIFIVIWDLHSEGTNWQQYNRVDLDEKGVLFW